MVLIFVLVVDLRRGAFVPLLFPPGDAFQFDFSHETVVLGGATMSVKVAHVRLCCSRKFYLRAYMRESQEMVFDAHERAFACFGGITARGIYDNMKTALGAGGPPGELLSRSVSSGDLAYRTDIPMRSVRNDLANWIHELNGQAVEPAFFEQS